MNQSKDQVIVRLKKEDTGNAELMMFDMDGKRIIQKVFTIEAIIDVSTLCKGVYILFIQKSQNYIVKRFMRN